MNRRVSLIILILLTGCSKPVTTVSDTFCMLTTRYRATEAQKAEFMKNEPLWRPLLEWHDSFNTLREKRC